MPRTTAWIVLGLGAVVVGYLVISHFSGGQQQGKGQGQGQGGRGGGYYGPGGARTVYVVREWQGAPPPSSPPSQPPGGDPGK